MVTGLARLVLRRLAKCPDAASDLAKPRAKLESISLASARCAGIMRAVVARFGEHGSMKVIGSVMTEQGITFAVVQVQAYKVETPQEAAETIQAFAPLFPGMPVVVMAIGKEAGPTYWGRDDLANFMAGIHPSSVEWRSYGFAGT